MPMKVIFNGSGTIRADLTYVWQAVTDVPNWGRWDPHFVEAELDGPFEAGSVGSSKVPGAPRGKFKISAVTPGREYRTESPLPGGTMYVTNRYEQIEPGRVSVFKEYELHGNFVPFFRLFYMKPIKHQLDRLCPALEAEANRRESAAQSGQAAPTDQGSGR
jgi:hypothetical protein